MKSNQSKLDGCTKPHDFKAVVNSIDNIVNGHYPVNFYRCSKCNGLVDAMSGLQYTLSGIFEMV